MALAYVQKKVWVLTDIDCDVRSDCLLGADDLDHFNVSHQLRLLRFGEESGLHTDTVRHARVFSLGARY